MDDGAVLSASRGERRSPHRSQSWRLALRRKRSGGAPVSFTGSGVRRTLDNGSMEPLRRTVVPMGDGAISSAGGGERRSPPRSQSWRLALRRRLALRAHQVAAGGEAAGGAGEQAKAPSRKSDADQIGGHVEQVIGIDPVVVPVGDNF